MDHWMVESSTLAEFARTVAEDPPHIGRMVRLMSEIAAGLTDTESKVARIFGTGDLLSEMPTMNRLLVASSWKAKVSGMNGVGDISAVALDLANGFDRLRAFLVSHGSHTDLPIRDPKLSALDVSEATPFLVDMAVCLDGLRDALTRADSAGSVVPMASEKTRRRAKTAA